MQKVILDVDTGTDDAIAIMTALLSPELDVVGICSINGNRAIPFTTENTLRVVEYMGAVNVPVHKGCALPMVSTLTPGRRTNIPYTGPEDPEDNVHGDYVELPPATIKAAPGNAVSWLIDTLMKSDGDIILIPVGPLTNLATALRAEPDIAKKIKQIVIMGGGYREVNITPSAEFNFWIDPEAAKIVMDSGCDITIVPLDATHAAAVSIEDARELRKIGTKASVAAADIIEHRWKAYKNWQPMADINTVPVHDALAVCAVLNPAVLKQVVFVHGDMQIGGGAADGQSIFDVDKRIKRDVPNVKVALGADQTLFAAMLKEILGQEWEERT